MQEVYAIRGPPPKKTKDFINFEPEVTPKVEVTKPKHQPKVIKKLNFINEYP